MDRRFLLVCEDHIAERVDALAREYNLPEQEVLNQLLELGLESVENEGVK